MKKVLQVTDAQVMAAKLKIEIAAADGRSVAPAILAIANARIIDADEARAIRRASAATADSSNDDDASALRREASDPSAA